MRELLIFIGKVCVVILFIMLTLVAIELVSYVRYVLFYKTECIPFEHQQVQLYWQIDTQELVCNTFDQNMKLIKTEKIR